MPLSQEIARRLLNERPPFALAILRHGETPANRAGLRCGGENDESLTPRGREQILALAARLKDTRPAWRPALILCGTLRRLQESAALLASALGHPPIMAAPGLNERLLGQWNGRPIEESEAALRAGATPPGGESEAAFADRLAQALRDTLLPRLDEAPLLVTSKGVARVLFLLLGGRDRLQLGNAELVEIRVKPGEGSTVAADARPFP